MIIRFVKFRTLSLYSLFGLPKRRCTTCKPYPHFFSPCWELGGSFSIVFFYHYDFLNGVCNRPFTLLPVLGVSLEGGLDLCLRWDSSFSSPVLCQLRHCSGKCLAWLLHVLHMPESVPQTQINCHSRMHVVIITNYACNPCSPQIICICVFSLRNEIFFLIGKQYFRMTRASLALKKIHSRPSSHWNFPNRDPYLED